MFNLIIDAANEKIIFTSLLRNNHTLQHINSMSFDNFMKLLLKFLNKKIDIKDITKIFVNLGPGKFTSLRISLSVAKAISLVNKGTLIGYKSSDLTKNNYKSLIKIEKKNLIIKKLVKPIYSS